ncbi:hypothetical protein ACIQLJ_03415 [Microbacterium sp. NPDC091313]
MHVASPTSVADLPALSDAWGSARAARDRLDALGERAGRVGDAMRWEAPSARAFDDAVDEVRRALRSAAELVDDAATALGRAVSCGATLP